MSGECPQGGSHNWVEQLQGKRVVVVCSKCGKPQ